MDQADFIEYGSKSDRRGDSRAAAVYRPVLLESENFTGFCLLRNLSPGGLMGEAYADFAVGEIVSIQFMPGHIVTGAVIWSGEGRIGVKFDEEIDPADSLRNMGSTYVESKLNRAPRLQIECEGEAEMNGRKWVIYVQDISQRGIKAMLPCARPGDEVLVTLPGMETRKAVIRWSQKNIAGLNFVRPIAFEELARWAIHQQSAQEPERVAIVG